jgi:hypothetical protein
VATHRCVLRRTAVTRRSQPAREPGCSPVTEWSRRVAPSMPAALQERPLRRTRARSARSGCPLRSTRRRVRARRLTRLSLNTMRTFSRTRVPPPSPTSRGQRRLDPLRSTRRGPRPTGVWLAPRTRRGPRPFTGPRLAPHTRADPRRNTSRLRIRAGPRRNTSHRLRIRPGLRCAISRPRPTTSLRRPLRVQVGRRMNRSGLSTAAVPSTGPSATGTASAPSSFRRPVERIGPSGCHARARDHPAATGLHPR